MMLTNDRRKIVRENLDLYSKAPLYPFTQQQLDRTRRWAFGETQTEIANSEGVGLGRVNHSVRTLALRVLEFAGDV